MMTQAKHRNIAPIPNLARDSRRAYVGYVLCRKPSLLPVPFFKESTATIDHVEVRHTSGVSIISGSAFAITSW
jgi:hypothetical protein